MNVRQTVPGNSLSPLLAGVIALARQTFSEDFRRGGAYPLGTSICGWRGHVRGRPRSTSGAPGRSCWLCGRLP